MSLYVAYVIIAYVIIAYVVIVATELLIHYSLCISTVAYINISSFSTSKWTNVEENYVSGTF